MSRRLDDTSRDILEFRPQIEFVEPEVQPGPIQPIAAPEKLEDVLQKADETRKLAKAVDTLAAALQAKADLRAKDMIIKLDPRVDAPVIAAMKRAHPGADPTIITYPQYAACKENQLQKGLDLAKQGLIDPEDIEKARASLGTGADINGFDAGFNSEEARTGGFRPERNEQNQIIAPLDMEETQDTLMKILVNFLWKNFIKPVIPVPPGVPALPDELVSTPKGVTPESFAQQVDDLSKEGKDQAENFPKSDGALQKAAANAGNLKATDDAITTEPIRNLSSAAIGDQARTNVNDPFAIQDCYTITRTFERGAAYCTTEESVFALLRPVLNNMRIVAGSQESRSLVDGAILDGALSLSTDIDEETTGDDGAISLSEGANQIIQDVEGSGARSREASVNVFNEWLKDCFPCDFRISGAGDFFSKFQQELLDRFLYYGQWYEQMLSQLGAIANIWNADAKFDEICALVNFFKNFICIPDLRRIIMILMILLMRISFEINGLFTFILGLVAPLVLPFLSGIVDMVEKFLLAIVKPIECIIDSLVNIVEKLNYNAIFQPANIRDVAVDVGPQGREFKSDGVNFEIKTPRITIETLGIDYNPPDQTIVEERPGKTFEGAEWGLSFNFLEDAPLLGDHMQAEEEAVREAQEELEEIRRRRFNVDFNNAAEREAYLQELEQAVEKRNQAVDDRDFTGGQQLRNFLETFKQDVRSVMITLAKYLREAIQAVEGFVAALVGEFRKLMASFLGDNGTVIAFSFKKMEIIKLVGMIISFIAWLAAGADCDEGDQDEPDVSSFIPNNEEARTIVVADDGTVTISERPDLIEKAIANAAATVGKEVIPDGQPEPGAEVVGTAADRSRQKLNSLVEFTGNPVLDTEIARVIDTITTPAQNRFRCPLQTTVAQAEQVNTWMRELNTT
jgi:hypothetical protein